MAKAQIKENAGVGEMTENDAANEAGALVVAGPEHVPALISGDGEKYEICEQVTRPVLQQHDNTPIFVKFDGKIVRAVEMTADDADDADDKKAKQKPPHIAPVTDLQSGELRTLVCGSVLWRELMNAYQEHGYVGRAFRLESVLVPMKSNSAKRIRLYDIKELRRAG